MKFRKIFSLFFILFLACITVYSTKPSKENIAVAFINKAFTIPYPEIEALATSQTILPGTAQYDVQFAQAIDGFCQGMIEKETTKNTHSVFLIKLLCHIF